MNDDGDFLLLSGLSHFCFCPRQWALIHVEQQWRENQYTQEGNQLHQRVHDADFTEKRGSVLLSRGMPVRSGSLRITGVCDMVEMTQDPEGIPIKGREGCWRLFPVEYKRGSQSEAGRRAAAMQLCAQAMCLEEMFVTDIPEGAVYAGDTHRRTVIALDADMRQSVRTALAEMHRMLDLGITPRCKPRASCKSCSLRDICRPDLMKSGSAKAYVAHMLAEEESP